MLLICTTLALGYCAKKKEDPGNTNPPSGGNTMADAEDVRQAKNALEIGYAQGDSARAVTRNVTLPAKGNNGVEVTWVSSDTGVISTDGTVTRPDMNTEVTLTTTLSKNAASDTKEFMLTVLAVPENDAAAVAQAKTILTIGYAQGNSADSVTQDISLPTAGPDGVAITWASTNAILISTAGVVTQPHGTTNASVTLTANLMKNAASDTKDFMLTVITRPFAWSAKNNASWSARYIHIAVVFDGKIWVLGGNEGSTHNGIDNLNEVWSSSDGMSWTNANARGPAEGSKHWSKRVNHAAVVFDGKIWVLGGTTDGSSRLNDVWSSSDGTTWTKTTVSGTHWSARQGHAMVVFDNKMWVLGGYDGRLKNDVWWSADGMSWTNANARGHWPARSAHDVVVFDNKMWVLGGYTGETNYKNDVWSSSDGMSWKKATDSAAWSGRFSHAAVVFDNKMWVLGGGAASVQNDVWWSTDGAAWTKLTNGTSHWPIRDAHAVVVLGDKMFLMGGADPDKKTRFNDVWVYQESN